MTRDELKKTKTEENISRRKALQKMSYAAFASSTMFLLLNNPTKVYASSQPADPSDGLKSGNAAPPDNNTKDEWNSDEDPWKQ